MAYTASFQNRPVVNQDHNRRNRKITSKEAHIDPQGHFEIWHDEDIREAYQRIFGKAQEEYNLHQKRTDRKILDYLKKIKNSNLKNPKKPVYEAIVQVGNRDNQPPEEVSRAILRQFYDDWAKSNPQMEIIGAYYHADEPNGTPHMHIDYVPVGEGYKRGLKKQNSLSKALEMQGFKDMQKIGDKSITPQQQWQFKEVARLEEICKSFGLDIYHPKRKHREHLQKQDYILQQKVLEQEREIKHLQQVNQNLSSKITEQNDELLANSIMLQSQPHDLKTQLDADLWQDAKSFLKRWKVKGKSLYDIFKEENHEKFIPWRERKDLNISRETPTPAPRDDDDFR